MARLQRYRRKLLGTTVNYSFGCSVSTGQPQKNTIKMKDLINKMNDEARQTWGKIRDHCTSMILTKLIFSGKKK